MDLSSHIPRCSPHETEIIQNHLGLSEKQLRLVARITQQYSGVLKHGTNEEWHRRLRNSGRSILTSTALMVAAQHLAIDNSKILSIVATYYSLFHGCFALLCQHPTVDSSDLVRIHHNRLQNEIDTRFVRTGLFSSKFREMYEKTRSLERL